VKRAYLRLVMLACLTLPCGAAQADKAPSTERRDQGAYAPPKAPQSAHAPKPVPPRQPPKLRPPASAMNHKTGSPAAAVSSPVRSSGHVGSAAPQQGNVRHRSPNPAVVTGSSHEQNPGALDGRLVHRRP
jgi:hypothetical protein